MIKEFFFFYCRIVLIPGTTEQQVHPFPVTQVKEGDVIGNIPVADITNMDDILTMKFILRYCNLTEKLTPF